MPLDGTARYIPSTAHALDDAARLHRFALISRKHCAEGSVACGTIIFTAMIEGLTRPIIIPGKHDAELLPLAALCLIRSAASYLEHHYLIFIRNFTARTQTATHTSAALSSTATNYRAGHRRVKMIIVSNNMLTYAQQPSSSFISSRGAARRVSHRRLYASPWDGRHNENASTGLRLAPEL
jgi:hypothetical protein